MILILTRPNDKHTELVTNDLKRQSARFECLHPRDFPQNMNMTITLDGVHSSIIANTHGRQIDINDSCSIWRRRPEPPIISESLTENGRDFADKECRHFMHSIWHILNDRFWVNSLQAGRIADHKPYQLAHARSVGLEIPMTVMTNQPSEAIAFLMNCENGAIYKPFHAASFSDEFGRTRAIYTNKITAGDIQKIGSIAHAPGILQEYVPKKLELRITVIGEKILACAIDSQASERSMHDWRRYDFSRVQYQAFQLGTQIESKIKLLMNRLHLVFGCIDMILTPDERLVFLEVNEAGQWAWIQQLTGLPISSHLATLLISGGRSHE